MVEVLNGIEWAKRQILGYMHSKSNEYPKKIIETKTRIVFENDRINRRDMARLLDLKLDQGLEVFTTPVCGQNGPVWQITVQYKTETV